MNHPSLRNAVVLAAVLAAASTPAAVVWNESVQGDLSGNGLAPTPLTFSIGENRVQGRMGRDDSAFPIDRDIFTFTLTPGQQLTSINVLSLTGSGGAGAFYAIAPGASISLTDPSGHLSNTLVSGTGELTGDLVNNPYQGGTGISFPLNAGTYTVWFQETSAEIGYDFAYTVVPEPAEAAAVGGALLLLAAMARRRLPGR